MQTACPLCLYNKKVLEQNANKVRLLKLIFYNNDSQFDIMKRA